MNQEKTITGWGQTKSASVTVFEPKTIEELQQVIYESSPESLIPRGLGRSYGDAALLDRGTIIDINKFNQIIIDSENACVTAGAGVSLNKLLKEIIPHGFFLPVSPGTKKVTIGGAIAADVHGKNHHKDGSFGNHLKKIIVIDGLGKLRFLEPNGDDLQVKQFWATIGGMGLTGVIVEATFDLIPISSSYIKVKTQRFKDIDSLMAEMINADKKYQYSVAWIDTLSKKGRGVLTCGDHAELNDLNNNLIKNRFSYNSESLATAPSYLPKGLLNKFTVSAFNEIWYRKSKETNTSDLQEIPKFFYPLDGIENWNNIYGKSGFIQYQYVIPEKESQFISQSIETLRKINTNSFLTVLKRFGTHNPGLLSFPKSGWTLAIDIPANTPNLYKTLDKLDEEVASKNGRIYLAKDVRQNSKIFRNTYTRFKEWKSIKNLLDPDHKFTSDLYKRLSQN
tara:strand:- start:1491 stop:2843 length:1353 start_codon:yes stop_codon:yes gene_type:complete